MEVCHSDLPVKRKPAVRGWVSSQLLPAASSGFTEVYVPHFWVLPVNCEQSGGKDLDHFHSVWAPQAGDCDYCLAETFSEQYQSITAFSSVSYAKASESSPCLSRLLALLSILRHFPQYIFCSSNSVLASTSQKTQADTLLIWDDFFIPIKECPLP